MQPIPTSDTVDIDEVVVDFCGKFPVEYHEQMTDAILHVYLSPRIRLKIRNREIVEKFGNGIRRRQLCREYHISRAQLGKILKMHFINARIAAKNVIQSSCT